MDFHWLSDSLSVTKLLSLYWTLDLCCFVSLSYLVVKYKVRVLFCISRFLATFSFLNIKSSIRGRNNVCFCIRMLHRRTPELFLFQIVRIQGCCVKKLRSACFIIFWYLWPNNDVWCLPTLRLLRIVERRYQFGWLLFFVLMDGTWEQGLVDLRFNFIKNLSWTWLI